MLTEMIAWKGKDAGSRPYAGDAIHTCIPRWFNARSGLRLPIRINIGSLLEKISAPLVFDIAASSAKTRAQSGKTRMWYYLFMMTTELECL